MNSPVPMIIIMSYVLKLCLPLSFTSISPFHCFFSPVIMVIWKAASLMANMTPPLPVPPVSIVFPATGVLLPLYLA